MAEVDPDRIKVLSKAIVRRIGDFWIEQYADKVVVAIAEAEVLFAVIDVLEHCVVKLEGADREGLVNFAREQVDRLLQHAAARPIRSGSVEH